MQIDDTLLAVVGVAISGGFAALWVQVRIQYNDLRSQLKDAVKRIRELEDERCHTLADVAKTNKELMHGLLQLPRWPATSELQKSQDKSATSNLDWKSA